MAIDPRLPVIVGVGQVLQRDVSIDDAREPVELMADAVQAAATDAGIASLATVESVRISQLLSWRYRDPARLVADALGITPRETAYTTMGGNTPQSLLNVTAAEIQRGDLDCAVLAGAECWRTRMRARREDAVLHWKKLPEDAEPTRVIGGNMLMSSEAEQARGLMMPVQLYPMFETAVRADRGEGVDEHQAKTSEMWSRFSAVAAKNPYAWVRRELTADEIRTPGPNNRMIGLPYPKYMNSNNDVDMSAALIVCSVEHAQRLGVSEDRWVFLHAGIGCHDTEFISNRAELHTSPAVQIGGRHVLELAGIGIDDIDVVDLYSCFPSAVQIGAAGLGLDLDRQLTRTGGLAFAGGPWNNYVTHAIATVVHDLREQPGAYGLVWGNGGFCTKHAFGIYSTTPPAGPARFDGHDIQPEIDAVPSRDFAAPADAAGPATVEAYTVMHSREGVPETAYAAALLADGRRAWGTSTDPGLAAAMCEGEWVGRAVTLDGDGTLHAE
jgi:acetyl-CoA C-acetyltransferase